MQSVQVSGRFVDDLGRGKTGVIRFEPSKLWVMEGDEAYATLAPEVELDDGRFGVLLSRTDTDQHPWHYTVHCPVGIWSIRVEADGPLLLKNLLPRKFA